MPTSALSDGKPSTPFVTSSAGRPFLPRAVIIPPRFPLPPLSVIRSLGRHFDNERLGPSMSPEPPTTRRGAQGTKPQNILEPFSTHTGSVKVKHGAAGGSHGDLTTQPPNDPPLPPLLPRRCRGTHHLRAGTRWG